MRTTGMRAFFRNPRVKAFLMFLVFVVVTQVLEVMFGYAIVTIGHLDPNKPMPWEAPWFIGWESLAFAGAIAATLVICLLQRRRLRDYGYAGNGALRQVLWGSVWGVVAPTALIALIAALGGFKFGTLAMSGTRLLAYTAAWLVAFFGLGLAEEAGYRATPQFTLGEAFGAWPAAVVISVIFAALHYYFKPGENIADALSVGLLGLFMAFTVIRSGSIWFAVGFHALFDYAALFIYGAPNSGNQGLPLATKLLTGGYHGPDWLTGGKLGIEASWLVFPVIAALFLGYHVATRRNTSSAPAAGYEPA